MFFCYAGSQHLWLSGWQVAGILAVLFDEVGMSGRAPYSASVLVLAKEPYRRVYIFLYVDDFLGYHR